MPPKPSGRDSLLTVRASKQELDLLHQIAKTENLTMSELVRSRLGLKTKRKLSE